MKKEEILKAINDGYKKFCSTQIMEVAKIWFPAWKAAQDILVNKGLKTQKDIIDLFGNTFINWFFDLDLALMENDMQSERLDFNLYILTIPDYMDLGGVRRNIAESLVALGRFDEAESKLSKWIDEQPRWTEGYTCWAQLLLDNDREQKAKEVIDRGMNAFEALADASVDKYFYDNAEIIYDRLGLKEKAQYCASKIRELSPKTSVKKNGIAVSTKVGRNEPCPCGSGKKYKTCCGR